MWGGCGGRDGGDEGMYIEEISVINELTGRKLKRHSYECDHCKSGFIKGRYSPTSRFCSLVCYHESQRSGVIKQEMETYFLEKYGVKNPYGSREIIEARKVNLISKYGVENVSQINDVKDKKSKTFMKHYGVTNNFGRASVVKLAQETMISRFGSIACATHPSIKAKLSSPEVNAKRFASWKRNGSLLSSKPERRLFKLLTELFDHVDQHVTINGWSIDVYVPAVDTYFQVDGVWWHGLDREIEVIENLAESGSRVNINILKKYKRDVAQNDWFKLNKMKLIRITDKAINAMNDNELKEWCLKFKQIGDSPVERMDK